MNNLTKMSAFTLLVLLLGAGCNQAALPPQPVACTMEAKICPDGSAVGRSGPSCEFAPCPAAEQSQAGDIRVASPKPNSVVRSPLTVSGEAKGAWYFEASFPVRLVDARDVVLAQVPAAAQGEWMTENFVPFSATLSFTVTSSEPGFLVFKKDNPSGLPRNDGEFRVPVTIEPK